MFHFSLKNYKTILRKSFLFKEARVQTDFRRKEGNDWRQWKALLSLVDRKLCLPCLTYKDGDLESGEEEREEEKRREIEGETTGREIG